MASSSGFTSEASVTLLGEPTTAAKPTAKPADSAAQRAKWQLVTAMVFCFVFMIGEVVGGYLAGSLAIMTDAAHLLSDVASFLISLFAVWLAERPATTVATFGYHRVEIFGALASVVLIWFLTGVLCFEAVRRVMNPEPVDGKIMFITATAGLLVNLAMMKILHQGGGHGHSHGGHGHSHGGHGHGHGGDEEENINVRAAFIHVVGDLVQSIGVMIAAGIIWAKPEAHIADPICTFLFSILVLFTTFGILRSAYGNLLNSVPPGISLHKLASDLYALPGVSNVHDLHVWSYGQGRVALTAHIVADVPEQALAGAQRVAASHGIKHSTLQVERCGTEDVPMCAETNALTRDCAIDLAPPTRGRGGHGHSHGPDHPLPLPLLRQETSLLDRPGTGTLHIGADGSQHPISPRVSLASAPASSPSGSFGVPGFGKAAAGSSGGHGHSHGGGHGHSHGGEDHGHSHSHGHSHGGSAGHGHSHGGHKEEEEHHGHSHDHHGHSHSHGHGHSH